jgi:hypothetical protein
MFARWLELGVGLVRIGLIVYIYDHAKAELADSFDARTDWRYGNSRIGILWSIFWPVFSYLLE